VSDTNQTPFNIHFFQTAQASRRGIFGAYLSTLALTLTNPMTILSFIAIFAELQI